MSDQITPNILKAIAGEYELTIRGLNARLADRAANIAAMAEEMEELRARLKAAEEREAAVKETPAEAPAEP